ncbi:MAG: hypothetical protein HWE27_03270 [Gammaproteobacteria bacterium]|nr:hypothetical protein [Gammaproteobacteria bacterium]
MTLKIPGTNFDFIVSPAYFLAEFDVFDREEDLGEELNKYDPNNPADLKALFNKYMFSGKIVERYSIKHKEALAKKLEETLSNTEFDFVELIESMLEAEDGFSLPSKWVIENPRLFFLEAYKAIYNTWGNDINNSGGKLKEPSELE